MRNDGSLEFSGGQDAGRSPAIIAKNQVAFATNTSMRGGFLKPRPALVKRTFAFSNAATETAFKTGGRFQHAAFFDGTTLPMLLSSQGGRLFKIDLLQKKISEITPVVARTTTTTVQFVLPAVNDTIVVSVENSYRLTPTAASKLTLADVPLTINGLSVELTAVNSIVSITVKNKIAANVGVTVPSASSVKWTYLDTNSGSLWQGWSTQAENYWIYQDNQSLPIIFNGSVARRSILSRDEVPVGNIMSYTMGRLIVALPDRTSFRVGDLVFGPSGNMLYNYRDAMLRFTENKYLNEGGDFVARVFGAPSGFGPITAIKPLSMMDSQLGQGPCVVGTPYVIFSLNLPFDRTTWKNLSSPLQTVTPVLGPVGQNNTVNINTDLWYRGTDGAIHSFIMARRDFTSWGNSPQSSELGSTLGFDTTWLLEYGSSVFFDNRRLETCSPVPSPYGIWHRGLVSLDFNLISSLRSRVSPAWEGVWSGLRFLQLIFGNVQGKERCFVFALNNSNEIEVWEFDLEAIEDNYTTPIRWTANMGSYNFTNGFNLKKLETGELFVDDVQGSVSMVIKYRSDQNPCWRVWDAFAFCSKNEDCGPFTCGGPISYREQFRSKIKLHQPPDDFDTINGRKYRTGYEFQPRLENTGHFELKQIRVLAFDEPETANAERSLLTSLPSDTETINLVPTSESDISSYQEPIIRDDISAPPSPPPDKTRPCDFFGAGGTFYTWDIAKQDWRGIIIL
jgi:hypothetical protein